MNINLCKKALQCRAELSFRTCVKISSGHDGDFTDSTLDTTPDGTKLVINGNVWAGLFNRALGRVRGGEVLAESIGDYKAEDYGISPFLCRDSFVSLIIKDIRYGNRLDSAFKSVEPGGLFSDEVAARGHRVQLRFNYLMEENHDPENLKGLFLKGFHVIHSGIENIGGNWGYGYGQLKVESVTFDILDLKNETGRKKLFDLTETTTDNGTPTTTPMPSVQTPVFKFNPPQMGHGKKKNKQKGGIQKQSGGNKSQVPNASVEAQETFTLIQTTSTWQSSTEKIKGRSNQFGIPEITVPWRKLRVKARIPHGQLLAIGSDTPPDPDNRIAYAKYPDSFVFREHIVESGRSKHPPTVTGKAVRQALIRSELERRLKTETCEEDVQSVTNRWFGFAGNKNDDGQRGLVSVSDSTMESFETVVLNRIHLCELSAENINLFSREFLKRAIFSFNILVDGREDEPYNRIKVLLESMKKTEAAPPGWHTLGATSSCTGQIEVLEIIEDRPRQGGSRA